MITNPPPANEVTKSLIQGMKQTCSVLEKLILDNIPSNRERSLALTNLEQASMWITKAILEGQAQAPVAPPVGIETPAPTPTESEAPAEPEPVEVPAEPELADLAPATS